MNTHYFRWEDNINWVPSKIDLKSGGVCVCVKWIYLVPNKDRLWVRRNSGFRPIFVL